MASARPKQGKNASRRKPQGANASAKASSVSGPNRLRPVEGHPPTAQIEGFSLFGSDLANAKVVSEIGSAAGGAAESRDRRQPAVRLLQEAHGRDQDVRPPYVERLQNAADQPHVVIARQPEDALSRAAVLERIRNQRRVVNQIRVVQHDALGRAGRARGVLQEGQRVAVDVGHAPVPLHLRRHLAGGQPGKLLQVRRFIDQRHHPVQHQVGRQGHAGIGIVGNGLNAIQRAISPGRIHRHGDHPCIDATEKGRNELQPRRIQQQGPLAHQVVRFQPGANRAGLAVQFSIGQMDLFILSVDQIRKGDIFRLASRAV